ncbi:hypothetical protein [Comamonas sp.]|uniref:hypothetical protein n=1 Tax=Comamonas sp. TaxID=34028 RepID=UPI0028A65F5B|nr:hypothetical protein [Comamonas sp.]
MPTKLKQTGLSRSRHIRTRYAAAGFALAAAAPYALAVDCEDAAYYVESTSCQVPQGMNIVNIRVDGAGGGAGGLAAPTLGLADGGAAGANGATVAGAMQVSPNAQLQFLIGTAGQQGANGSDTPMAGGTGGSGDGPGGAGGIGGDGGGGGGGGGASSLTIAGTSMWIRAGGGGGGGGAGPLGAEAGRPRNDSMPLTKVCTNAAASGGNGGNVEPITPNGPSGGGGGNGGTYANAASTALQANSASQTPPAHGSEGGFTGDSCAPDRVEFLFFEASGNSRGGINAEGTHSTPASNGGVFFIFGFDPDRTAQITAISSTGVSVQEPQAMPPGYAVNEYRVTCTGSAGGNASGSAPGPAASANIPMSLPGNQIWTCEVTTTLVDSTGGDSITTIPTSQQSSHTDIGPEPPRAPARVPVLGAAGAASLGVLGLATWMGLRRRSQ